MSSVPYLLLSLGFGFSVWRIVRATPLPVILITKSVELWMFISFKSGRFLVFFSPLCDPTVF